MANIILKKLTKVYPNNFKVIEGLDLEIKDKEFIVLVGPSGCGKSTTLRLVAGLEAVTSGDIIISDRIVTNVLPKDRNISMVFQSYALYPHLTIYENMAFPLKLRKVNKKIIGEKIQSISKILEIDDILNKKPDTISGGQKQRVALGRAIIREPEVFLFDEPLSNLDAKLRATMRVELVKLHKQLGTTFVYVTHDQTEAMTMGGRIAVMKEGKIMQFDSPEKTYKVPQNIFTAGFIGTPQMNFIKLNDKTIGIRPENLFIKNEYCDISTDMTFDECYVEAIELLGAEKLAYFNCSGTKLVSKLPEYTEIAEGSRYSLYCKRNNIHTFDSITGLRVD